MRERWIAAAALAVLLLLAALPRTGWLVRQQLGMLVRVSPYARWLAAEFSSQPTGEDRRVMRDYDRALLSAAERRPHDLGAQIAAAGLRCEDSTPAAVSQAVGRLRTLAASPANRTPEVWAAIVRLECTGLELGRTKDQAAVASLFAPKPTSPPARFAALLADAREGDIVDPGNAFFPQMASAALFGLHRDPEALAALHHAARDSRWDDHVLADENARLRLGRQTFGRRGALAEMAAMARVLFPDFGTMRAAAHLALFDATQAERAGDPAKGVAIRHDLMRVGALMRGDSSGVLGALVGFAIVGIARTRPGGCGGGERGCRNVRRAGQDAAQRRVPGLSAQARSQ